MTRPSPRRAFTLVEMLIVMLGIAAILGLAFLGLNTAIRLQRADANLFRRTLSQAALADQFRTDVHTASAAPSRWQDFESGPACLILEQGERHIVYYWNGEQLLRQEFGPTPSERILPHGGGEGVSAVLDRPTSALCRVRLRGATPQGSTQPRFLFDCVAALGSERP